MKMDATCASQAKKGDSNCCLFFPCQAWDASGITVDGCRLSYQEERTSDTCKREVPVIYHGARYRIPFSRKFSHFKVS